MESDKNVTIGTDQFVTFWLEAEEFGIPIRMVQEIVKKPKVRSVPNAPSFIEGIGDLRGKVLPIANLRARLGMAAKESDKNTRVVVLNIGGVATGLVVDRISEVLRIEKNCLEAPQNNLSGNHGQILRSIAKFTESKRLILILDENKLLPELESMMEHVKQTQTEKLDSALKQIKHVQEELEQVVTFKLGREEFSLNIMEVKEIIRMSNITTVPNAPESLVGVMSLRNRLIPILDLRNRFGMCSLNDEVNKNKKIELLEARRIVITDVGGSLVGILVDSVSQVLRLEKNQIEAPPAIMSDGHQEQIKGIGKLDKGNRLVMQMNLETLLSENERKHLVNSTEGHSMESQETQKQDTRHEDEVQLVAFRLAKEEYALPIVKVLEIIKIKKITTVPQTKSYIEGIINLRGNIVPVIDLRARFGIERHPVQEQRRVVVVDINGKTNGFIVDSVTEVLSIRKSQIESIPASVADDKTPSFVDGIGKLNEGKRIILMVNPDLILVNENEKELELLAS